MMQNAHAASPREAPIRPNREVTSTRCRERARHYWYAAALADDPQNIRRFLDLAWMFERLARDFKRFEAPEPPFAVKVRSCRSSLARAVSHRNHT
jgi:hypothetical protein